MNFGSFENLVAQIGCGVSGVGYKRELNFILYVVGMLLQGSEKRLTKYLLETIGLAQVDQISREWRDYIRRQSRRALQL